MTQPATLPPPPTSAVAYERLTHVETRTSEPLCVHSNIFLRTKPVKSTHNAVVGCERTSIIIPFCLFVVVAVVVGVVVDELEVSKVFDSFKLLPFLYMLPPPLSCLSHK